MQVFPYVPCISRRTCQIHHGARCAREILQQSNPQVDETPGRGQTDTWTLPGLVPLRMCAGGGSAAVLAGKDGGEVSRVNGSGVGKSASPTTGSKTVQSDLSLYLKEVNRYALLTA